MDNLQLVLVGGNGVATDLSFDLSAEAVSAYFGTALIERVPRQPCLVWYKLFLGRMVKLGFSVRKLESLFKHDHRTLRRWAEVLHSDDAGFVARTLAGQGAMPKVTPELRAFATGQYAALNGRVRDYRRRIGSEVEKRFGVKLSGETLRQLFAAGENAGQAGAVKEPAAASETVGVVLPVDDAPACEGVPSNARAVDLPGLALFEAAPEAVTAPPSQPAVAVVAPLLPDQAAAAAGLAGSLPEAEPGMASQGEKGCQPELVLSSEAGASSNHSPTPPAVAANAKTSGPDGVEPKGNGIMPVSGFGVGPLPCAAHHAGLAIFSPWLDLVGFDRGADRPLEAQWLGQILQGAVNLEQSKAVRLEDLALFTGPVVADTDTQRDELRRRATPEATLALLAANVRLLADGPGTGLCFYYDPHTKQYTGDLKLLKGWCGRRHSVEKVLHLDFIHTRLGDPCFVQHFDNFHDLRERFAIALRRFDQLFPADLRAGRTFIIDRAIFGEEAFAGFFARGDWLVTWEKGYSDDGWDEAAPCVEFVLHRPRNRADDLRQWRFQCQETRWTVDPRFRRIVVRSTNPEGRTFEAAVLCSNPFIEIKEAVALIFNRWIQENDFRCLDTHFGIMQLTSYAARPYAEIQEVLRDRPVACREYRRLQAERQAHEAKLGKLLWHREQLTDALAACQQRLQAEEKRQPQDPAGSERQAALRRRLASLARSLAGLETKLATAKEALAPIQEKLDAMLADTSRLDQLIGENYHRLDTGRKEYMDVLKITARNIFRRAFEPFRALYDNRRDDHLLLRLLTQSPGRVRRAGQAIEIALWPRARLTPAQTAVCRRYLQVQTEFINGHFHGRAAPIRLTLPDNAPFDG